MKHRFLCSIVSAVLVLTPTYVPSITTNAEAIVYSELNDRFCQEYENVEGDGTLNVEWGDSGTFSCNWNGVSEFTVESGEKLDGTHNYKEYGYLGRSYNVAFAPYGVSYFGYTGWLSNPETKEKEIEFAIVEAWGAWRPGGSGKAIKKVIVDGKSYEIFTTTEYDENGKTHEKYWSVAQNNPARLDTKTLIKGTVNVSEHFSNWEKCGLDMSGTLDSLNFFVTGYNDKGSLDLKYNSNFYSVPDFKATLDDISGETYKNAFINYFQIGRSIDFMQKFDKNTSEYVANNFGCITPEFALDPDFLLDQEACIAAGDNVTVGVNFEAADDILTFCEKNGLGIFGSTFVWYSRTPDWFFREDFNLNAPYVSEEIMNQRLESFINNTFDGLKKNYPDLIINGYEVAKEIFENDGGGLRKAENNRWAKIYGDDEYVFKAFEYAREYAPEGTPLYLSDYNEWMPDKTDDICDIANRLNDKGLIDGIGMEAYFYLDAPSTEMFTTAIDKFAATGLDIMLTEFSVNLQTSDNPIRIKKIRDIFNICLEKKDDIVGIIFGQSLGIEGTKLSIPTIEKLLEYEYIPDECSGDANGDAVVNIADVVTLRNWLIEDESSDIFWKAADINDDDQLDIFDINILKSVIKN